MGKVIKMKGLITTLPIDPDQVLEAAKGNLDHVLVVGVDKSRSLYVASSSPDMGEDLLLLRCAEQIIVDQALRQTPPGEE